jgi:VWFA-related protein
MLTLTNKALSDESEIMNAAAESNVTISALDARGLYVSETDASERGGSSSRSYRLKSEYRRSSMSLNENVMDELPAGTGGTYFHHSNDLQGGFKRLIAGPEYLYLLEFSIGAVKQNGSHHRLKVKVDRDRVTVQSRRGYSAPKSPKKKNKVSGSPEQG